MKLIELLSITDPMSTVVIWGEHDDDNPIFEGCVEYVPWSITDRKIISNLEGGTCAISIRNSEDDGSAIMVISIEGD